MLSGMHYQADPETLVRPCIPPSVSALQYGAGQTVWSPGTADCMQKHINPEMPFAPLLLRQDRSTHLSFSKYGGLQGENHILLEELSASQRIQPRAGFAVP